MLTDRALVARALLENRHLINWWLTFKAFYGVIALICGNGYIVGINQIYDIGIDKYLFLFEPQLLSIIFFLNLSFSAILEFNDFILFP